MCFYGPIVISLEVISLEDTMYITAQKNTIFFHKGYIKLIKCDSITFLECYKKKIYFILTLFKFEFIKES